jgi:hypothetical protein
MFEVFCGKLDATVVRFNELTVQQADGSRSICRRCHWRGE